MKQKSIIEKKKFIISLLINSQLLFAKRVIFSKTEIYIELFYKFNIIINLFD